MNFELQGTLASVALDESADDPRYAHHAELEMLLLADMIRELII